jgi:hypothetical protein
LENACSVGSLEAAEGGDMWWEPRDEQEQQTLDIVDRLVDRYRAYLEELDRASVQLVFGVGTRFDADGVLRPSLLVDSNQVRRPIPRPPRAGWPGPGEADDLHRFAPELLGEELLQLLAGWELNDSIYIQMVEPPEPAAHWSVCVGDQLRCPPTEPPGTVGLPIGLDALGRVSHFLTCGHVVSRHGGGIGTVRSRTGSMSGLVVHACIDPREHAPDPSWDLAVVGTPVPPVAAIWSTLASPPTPPISPIEVVVSTGRGDVRGSLSGTLAAGGGLGCQWRSCWQIGVPAATPLRHGDSGSLVAALTTGEVYGHFVGGNTFRGSTEFLNLFVQDLRCAMDDHPNWPIDLNHMWEDQP